MVAGCFNPRPREAGDSDMCGDTASLSSVVSIHARAKRATRRAERYEKSKNCFNPRPREAGDGLAALSEFCQARFNPRPREAGDAEWAPDSRSAGSFNPRPREAGDGYGMEQWDYGRVSIHARAKRATWANRLTSHPSWFQSTPARSGRRDIRPVERGHAEGFNPRPREAGDDGMTNFRKGWRVSIHARAKRATTLVLLAPRVQDRFNPRPREAGDHQRPDGLLGRLQFQSTPARSGRPS